MNKFHSSVLAGTLALLVGGASAVAAPITYTETGTGSGSLGANAFTRATVTITFSGDTANVSGGTGFFTNQPITATVSISGIATATFTDNPFAFDNQGLQTAGIGDSQGSILDTQNAAFAGYDLTTNIGPLTGSSFIRPDLSFSTTSGAFTLSSFGDVTFTATTTTAVPEPAPLAMLGVGVIGLGLMRRLRAK